MMVWLNGAFVTEGEARVSASDRGFLLGDGAFETVRFEGGSLRRWARHERRLLGALEALGISAETLPDMPALAGELVQANRLETAIIRLTVSRGAGGRGLEGKDDCAPTVLVSAQARTPLTPPRLAMLGAPRRAPLTLSAHFKMLGYGDNVFARREAKARGADMAVMLSASGHVACADCANLFWVTGRTVFTPGLETGALAGTTRAAILGAAASQGLHIEEGFFRPESLASAEAVVLTNAVHGAVAAASMDGRALKTGHALVDLICRLEREAD
ncbi:MAG: aminotransferase class IV [Glycocaulis sp.]